MLLGGITKSEQADKLIWICMGIGIALSNSSLLAAANNGKERMNNGELPRSNGKFSRLE
jgi:hypothetical protein